jgi:hypothetical protein
MEFSRIQGSASLSWIRYQQETPNAEARHVFHFIQDLVTASVAAQPDVSALLQLQLNTVMSP